MAETHAEYLARRKAEETERRNAIVWTPEQILGARIIKVILANAPKCPECGCDVMRPNCAYDADNCPRHALWMT